MLSCSCSVYTFIVFYSFWKKADTFGRGLNTVEEKQRGNATPVLCCYRKFPLSHQLLGKNILRSCKIPAAFE